MHRPRLLVLDEPTVGLDIDSRRDIVAHVHAPLPRGGAGGAVDDPPDRRGLAGRPGRHLHRGRVRAAGAVEGVTAEAGTADLAEAYLKLTARAAA